MERVPGDRVAPRYAHIMSAAKDWPANDARSPSERAMGEQELSEFLLRLCHDLRTPLRAIRAHTELLRRGATDAADSTFQERLGFVISGAQGMELLTEGLSNYSLSLRIDAGSFQVAQIDVLLRLVLAKLRQELQAAGAEVTYDALPRVSGNPDRLSQLLEILILNAIRHRGAEAPRIHVTAERQNGQWLFRIRDNGMGIEPAYLQRIFQPFERLRGKSSPGPGLGLAIAKKIVEKHGGQIWAESQSGAGSTFFFTLPAE